MATSSDDYFGEAPRPDNQGRLALCVRSGISKCAVGQFWKKKAVKGKRIDIKQDSVMHALVNIHKVRFLSIFLTFLLFLCSTFKLIKQDGKTKRVPDFHLKDFMAKDENAEWWDTTIFITEILEHEMETELRNNMDSYEYVMGAQGHCMYVHKYDPEENRVVCINSYGDKDDPYPFVNIGHIEKLYRVTFSAKIKSEFC